LPWVRLVSIIGSKQRYIFVVKLVLNAIKRNVKGIYGKKADQDNNMNYSLENAEKFKWSSISNNLNPERLSHLEIYLKGNKILDAGCGGGAYVEYLVQKGFEVTGIDKYEEFLAIAKAHSQNGSFLKGDLTKLPFLDKEFDCTYCFDVLEHVDDLLVIKELARVTKNRLIITVPKEDDIMSEFNLTFLHNQDKTHLRNYTELTLENLIKCVTVSDIYIFPELSIPVFNLVREMIDTTNSASFKCRKVFNSLLIRSLKLANYKKIYTSLVAVIDL
jgi:2-polyprenyl-3-methyl-5-hydroxy-6-metoxy-1,4-benzoquinol methylase